MKTVSLLTFSLVSSFSILAMYPSEFNPLLEAAKNSLKAQNKPATHEAMVQEVCRQADLELAKMKRNSDQHLAEMAISSAHALAKIEAEGQAFIDELLREAVAEAAARKAKK